MFVYTRKIQYYETDKMSIVHHSNYIRFFEEARCAFLSDIKLDFDYIESMGLMCPVVSVDCKYISPLKFADEMFIETELECFNGVKMEFSYKVFNSSRQLCAEGASVHCLTDESLKPVSVRRTKPEFYEKLKNALNLD